jgi:nucleoid DNA-binding protein
MMEQLSSNLAGTTNCTKQQLYGVLQLYFNNMTNELYNFVIETRATSNLLNNKSLLNSMIVNSFEQILQDNNTQIDYFKYNSKNISNILSYYIDKNTITQLLLNLIEQTDITNHQIKTILDNTFIPLLNNNFKP